MFDMLFKIVMTMTKYIAKVAWAFEKLVYFTLSFFGLKNRHHRDIGLSYLIYSFITRQKVKKRRRDLRKKLKNCPFFTGDTVKVTLHRETFKGYIAQVGFTIDHDGLPSVNEPLKFTIHTIGMLPISEEKIKSCRMVLTEKATHSSDT